MDISPEFEAAWQHLETSPLKAYATEIGYLCIYWSTVENQIDGLLLDLMDIKTDDLPVIILANMDLRQKISAAITLCFNRKPNEQWFLDVQSQLNVLDNDLRPLRNRYVHDYWVAIGNDVYKFQRQAKVYKEQSRTLAVKYGQMTMPKLPEIRVLIFRVMAIAGQIMEFRRALTTSRDKVPAETHKENPDPDQNS